MGDGGWAGRGEVVGERAGWRDMFTASVAVEELFPSADPADAARRAVELPFARLNATPRTPRQRNF